MGFSLGSKPVAGLFVVFKESRNAVHFSSIFLISDLKYGMMTVSPESMAC